MPPGFISALKVSNVCVIVRQLGNDLRLGNLLLDEFVGIRQAVFYRAIFTKATSGIL